MKKGHQLLSSYIAIGEDSNGFQILTRYCKDNNIDGCKQYYIERMIQILTQNAGFESIKCITNGESFGEKNNLDLIPFEDEWYRVFLVECFK